MISTSLELPHSYIGSYMRISLYGLTLLQLGEGALDPPPDVFIPTSGHWISTVYNSLESLEQKEAELKTLEWRISLSMLDLLFFLISRLNYACSPLVINLQIN